MKLFTRVIYTTVNAFNAHTILGLQKMASQKQIKIAYFSLAKQYHPDSNPGKDTSEQFQRVTQAYEFMMKEAVKGQRTYKSQEKGQFHSRGQGNGQDNDRMFKAYQTYKRKNNVKNDSFHKFMEFYQDYMDQKRHTNKQKDTHTERQRHFEQQFNEFQEDEQEETSEDVQHNQKRYKHRNKKLEINMEVQISAEQAKIGTDKRIRIIKKMICTTCHGRPHRKEIRCKKCLGSGVHISKNQIGFCWTCGGSRTVTRCECVGCGGKGNLSRQTQEIVHIKPAIQNNEEIVIKGKGHQHPKKGFFGDLIIQVRIKGSESQSSSEGTNFRQVGFNTYQTVKITVIQAVLGTKLKYNTVWGQRTLPMRGGVQDGAVIKRNGQGCRKRSHKDNGHHFITVSVEIPSNISQQEIQIYQRIREIYKTHKHRSH